MQFKKYIKETFITLLVISLTAVWYAAVWTVSSWQSLTATLWNEMKDIVNSNELKLTNITNLGTDLGIWINWNIKSVKFK